MANWCESVIDRLASDLQVEFPRATGFSSRSLRDMKRLYLAYSDGSIWPQAVAQLAANQTAFDFLRQLVAQIPWGHHRLILDKLAEPTARLFYLRATARFGWSRNVLLNQIKAGRGIRTGGDRKERRFRVYGGIIH